MKIAVCGGRDVRLTGFQRGWLGRMFKEATEVVTGGCRGVDLDAEQVARDMKLPVKTFRPAWDKHGKAAGPLRNAEIAAYADVLIAFPGGRGTRDMVRQMEDAGKEVFSWEEVADAINRKPD